MLLLLLLLLLGAQKGGLVDQVHPLMSTDECTALVRWSRWVWSVGSVESSVGSVEWQVYRWGRWHREWCTRWM
jgi:hypothetical protein